MPDQIDLSKMDSVGLKVKGHLRIRRYWLAATSGYWDDLWDHTASKEYWRNAMAGLLPAGLEGVICRYLSQGAKILEAGCGIGHLVIALRQKGYDCYGLDYAELTIDVLKGHFPEAPFTQGDIRNLPYESEFFDAYISLGVIEHFTEGQEQMLAEAARVLKPGGKILLSVPAVNAYRLWRYKVGLYKNSSDKPFFEDCYTLSELKNLLHEGGFSYLEHHYQNPVMTFVQESFLRPLYFFVEDTRFTRSIIDRTLNFILPKQWFGHMLLVVGEKGYN